MSGYYRCVLEADMQIRISILVLCIALFAPNLAQADGTLIMWGPTDIEGMTEARWNAAKTRTPEQLLELNLHVRTWADVYDVALGARAHSDDGVLLDGLISQLTNSQETKLTGTKHLIIWDRIVRGDILFVGRGMQIDDDIFSVAGRANWILRTVFKKRYGTVRPGSTDKNRSALQIQWRKYVAGEIVTEEPNRYTSQQAGLTELRSPQAINALIVSLRDSKQKREHTKLCLKRLYQLDTLPTGEHPARLCSPDTSIHGFLTVITTVTGQHDYAWWVRWCRTNLRHLVWNAKTAKFDIL